jgi:predicted Zn-dependent peptidase
MNQYEEVSRENVKDYHEKYYTPDNIIVVDDTNNYEVIQA